VVVGPEIDELVEWEMVERGLLVEPSMGRQHPLRGERDPDRDLVEGLRAARRM
jgi:hypothetical protein